MAEAVAAAAVVVVVCGGGASVAERFAALVLALAPPLSRLPPT